MCGWVGGSSLVVLLSRLNLRVLSRTATWDLADGAHCSSLCTQTAAVTVSVTPSPPPPFPSVAPGQNSVRRPLRCSCARRWDASALQFEAGLFETQRGDPHGMFGPEPEAPPPPCNWHAGPRCDRQTDPSMHHARSILTGRFPIPIQHVQTRTRCEQSVSK